MGLHFAVHVGYWAYRDIYALSNLAKAMYYIALNLVTDNSQKRTGQALFFSFEYNLTVASLSTRMPSLYLFSS